MHTTIRSTPRSQHLLRAISGVTNRTMTDILEVILEAEAKRLNIRLFGVPPRTGVNVGNARRGVPTNKESL